MDGISFRGNGRLAKTIVGKRKRSPCSPNQGPAQDIPKINPELLTTASA